MKKRLFLGMLLTVCVIIISFVFSQFYPGGMIAYWKFDEGEGAIAYDSVNGNHGQINGASWATGIVGGALHFDGWNDYVNILGFGNVAPTSEITIEAWVKPGVSSGQDDLFCFEPLVNDNRITIHFPWNWPEPKIHWQFGKPPKGVLMLMPSEFVGVWQHFVFIASSSGNFCKIFRNGVEVAFAEGMNSFERYAGNWHIGGRSSYSFNGSIDEVAVYDRVLTEDEIQQHYVNGLNGMGYEVECVPPPTDMVSWWPGDGNADDIVDGNHGMLENGATFAAGMVDQAFSFDGVDDYIFVGNPMDLNISSDITIDAWINPHDLGEGQVATILTKWPQTVATDSYVISIKKLGGVIKIIGGIGDGITPDSGLLGGEIPSNTWSHVAMTYNSATDINKLYKNGSEVASRSRPNGIHISNAPVLIGAFKNLYASNPQWYFPGLIDEVEIFNRTLTASEIQAIYHTGSAGKCKFINEVPVAICQDIEVAVDENCDASITPADVDDGSYDPDDDPITLSIDPPGPFTLGEHYVTLTVTDEHEESDSCDALVTVVDSIPPIPDVPELPTVTGECFAEITSIPTATDNCAGTIQGTTTDFLIYGNQGTYTVTWTYDDGNGNVITQTQTVVVQDVTPPVISVTFSPNILWPPNHKMVLITPTIAVSDNCDPEPEVRLTTIIMNEGEETNTYDPTFDSWEGDGHTFDDIQFDEDGKFYLRAERSGRGDGRVYQITYTATDDAGNTSTASATVTVPHNQ